MEDIEQFEIDCINGFLMYADTDICAGEASGIFVRYEDHLRIINELKQNTEKLPRNP